MTNNLSSQELNEVFIDTIMKRAYINAIKTTRSILEKELRHKKTPEAILELRTWYQNLPSNHQSHILEIIQESVKSSVFGFLVVLDGLYMGDPTSGELAEWVLYYQRYENLDDKKINNPKESIRLNSISGVKYLHDLFLDKVDIPQK